ncbi:MAG: hypothetical protein FWG44_01565 [Oscillospiraceae bacterium]|nr:hypothetical protein [Oscillospiraceae bacterium]
MEPQNPMNPQEPQNPYNQQPQQVQQDPPPAQNPYGQQAPQYTYNPVMPEPKKKVNPAGIIAGVLVVVLVLVFAVFSNMSSPKEFSKAGLTITLTDKFDVPKERYPDFDVVYESRTSMMAAIKEDFGTLEYVGIPSDISLREYAEMVMDANRKSGSVKEKDGLVYFEYTDSNQGQRFSYFATVFRGKDAYWLVQFFCEEKNYDKLQKDFIKWAQSVEV